MDDWRPYRLHRKARLDELLKEAGGPKALMRLSGVTDTYLTACKKGNRAVGDDVAGKLERVMGRPFGWMDTPPDGAGSQVVHPAPVPSIETALGQLGEAVGRVPADRVSALAETLAGWVKSTAKEPWTSIVLQLLGAPVDRSAATGDAGAPSAAAVLNSNELAPPASPNSSPSASSKSRAVESPRPHGEGHAT